MAAPVLDLQNCRQPGWSWRYALHFELQRLRYQPTLTSGLKPKPQRKRTTVCPVCHRSFYQRSDLKRHSVTHTGEKPYRCTEPGCHKRYTQRGDLTRHWKHVHINS